MQTFVLRLFLSIFVICFCFAPRIAQADVLEAAIITQRTIREGHIDIEYPVVSGLKHAIAAERINSLVTNHAKRFHTAVAANPNIKQAVHRYTVHHNAEGILSLTITQYDYSGGAHGMSYMKGYTFDLATGYLYRFTDLVPPWERAQINQTILQQIADQSIPLLQDFTGIKAEPDFYLSPERKVVIFYQLYELAPYAWGFVRFPVSD